MQRALRMPQCRVIPFFGTFLYDLYSIVNDLPNIVVIGHDGDTDKLKVHQILIHQMHLGGLVPNVP